ncbi:MAG TPA: CvpA family protein [Magnetospirillum sp.]|jgi:membrane protein required for colicin V production|nr:CvpA family protein [Magnetospirillum sp.]
MGNFTAVDIIVAVVMLGLAAFSFMRGFVHQVLAIGAWIGAVAATFYGFPLARPFFRNHIDSALGADVATGISLFLVSLLVLSIATKAISDRVRRSALNSVDSSLGFVFGLGLGAALVSLGFLLVTMLTGPELPDWLATAKTRPWLERGANLLKGFAPEGFGTAEHKAKEVKGEAHDLMDAEQKFRQFVAPLPASGTDDKGAPPAKAGEAAKPGDKPAKGYDKESRGQMDRLFQTNQ